MGNKQQTQHGVMTGGEFIGMTIEVAGLLIQHTIRAVHQAKTDFKTIRAARAARRAAKAASSQAV